MPLSVRSKTHTSAADRACRSRCGRNSQQPSGHRGALLGHHPELARIHGRQARDVLSRSPRPTSGAAASCARSRASMTCTSPSPRSRRPSVRAGSGRQTCGPAPSISRTDDHPGLAPRCGSCVFNRPTQNVTRRCLCRGNAGNCRSVERAPCDFNVTQLVLDIQTTCSAQQLIPCGCDRHPLMLPSLPRRAFEAEGEHSGPPWGSRARVGGS
jgi:hypothetical protein